MTAALDVDAPRLTVDVQGIHSHRSCSLTTGTIPGTVDAKIRGTDAVTN
jgi:hypothetical protein